MPAPLENFAPIVLLGVAGYLIVYLFNRRSSNQSNLAYLDLSAFRDCDLPDLSFRPFENSDSAFCQKLLHDLADAELCPPGHDDSIIEWLKSEGIQKWILLSESEPVACGGLSTVEPATEDGYTATGLTFGLMNLDLQNRGLGSLSLALRVRMIPQQDLQMVHLLATSHSHPYFKRFGFVELPDAEQPHQQPTDESPLTSLGVMLTSSDQLYLDNYLKRHFAQLGKD